MPYKPPKMTPKAAARARAAGRANARTRQSLMTPGRVTTTGVAPIGAALGAVYRAAASRRTSNAMMTPSQRRRANVDPVVVEKRLASLARRSKASPESEKRARASAARTKRTSEARQIDKMDDAARRAEVTKRNPNKMVPKPRFTRSGSKRLVERKEALNSPTRTRYKPGPIIKQRGDERTPYTTPAESMRFSGKTTREGYQPAGQMPKKPGAAPESVSRRVKVPRKPKPASSLVPRRTTMSEAERREKNRVSQDYAGRYGRGPSDAQKIADRQKWREAQAGKPAKPKAPTPREMEANKAAIAGERIRPVAARPKTKVSTKIKAEEERVRKQNPKAAEREAKAKADVAKPRGTASPYKPSESATRRSADVAARREAAAERLRNALASRKKGSRKP